MENTNNVTQQTRVKRTPDERKQHRREYLKSYMQAYRAANPQKTKEWRIKSAKSLLQREGYDVVQRDDDDGDFDIVITNPDRIFEGFAEGGDSEA